MEDDRHITWQNFRDNFIKRNDPGVHKLPGSPVIELYTAANSSYLAIRIFQKKRPDLPKLPFRQLSLSIIADDDDWIIELSVSDRDFYESFYSLMVYIADQIQLNRIGASVAIAQAIEKFAKLIQINPLMTEEYIIGVWGELYILKKLINNFGTQVVSMWLGPEKEDHDFRLTDNVELEIKTTRSSKRTHIINSLSQLQPSPDHLLYLVSIQIASGSGDESSSLTDSINEIKEILNTDTSALNNFKDALKKLDYDERLSEFYDHKYQLRTEPTLVPVDEKFPRITGQMIVQTLGQDLASRLDDIQYRIDVSELGFEADSHEYKKILNGA